MDPTLTLGPLKPRHLLTEPWTIESYQIICELDYLSKDSKHHNYKCFLFAIQQQASLKLFDSELYGF
jgi:hypothetical protein